MYCGILCLFFLHKLSISQTKILSTPRQRNEENQQFIKVSSQIVSQFQFAVLHSLALAHTNTPTAAPNIHKHIH